MSTYKVLETHTRNIPAKTPWTSTWNSVYPVVGHFDKIKLKQQSYVMNIVSRYHVALWTFITGWNSKARSLLKLYERTSGIYPAVTEAKGGHFDEVELQHQVYVMHCLCRCHEALWALINGWNAIPANSLLKFQERTPGIYPAVVTDKEGLLMSWSLVIT